MEGFPHGAQTPPRSRVELWSMGLAAIVGIGSLALTLSGLLARRIPPSTAWWLQPAVLLLPVMAPLTGLAGLGWSVVAVRTGRGGAWVLAALHLGAAGVVLWRMAGGLSVAEEAKGDVLRVMTLNSAWSRRGAADEIGRRFSEANPHVIALQEISIRPGSGEGEWVAQGAGLALLEDSTYTLTVLDRASNPGQWLTNGTALFTRVPAGLSQPVLLDTASATNSGKYTRTEIEWEGRTVAVYNVHVRSFTAPRPSRTAASWREWGTALRASKRDFIAREAEARVLRRALDAEPLPFVVLGDFNATPDHWTYAHVAQGLVDALDAAPGFAWTYPDLRPLVRIDAVLASSEWSVRTARVQPPGVSDHRLVLVELQWNR